MQLRFGSAQAGGGRREEADFSLRYRDWEIMLWGGFGFDLKWKGALVYFCLWAWSVELHHWWGLVWGEKNGKIGMQVDPNSILLVTLV